MFSAATTRALGQIKKKIFDGEGECIKCWAAQAAGECIMQIFAY